jgi:hypothetical protein
MKGVFDELIGLVVLLSIESLLEFFGKPIFDKVRT